jgi:cytochrome c oxidase subunit 4|tara:strand:+ start:1856 stop:2206 length:351 start_codon:yes stop_codon:yes gene_type:complete
MGGHNSPEDIKKETRTYLLVFVALAVATVLTVAVSYLDLTTPQAVTLALFIATIKGGLVAAFFMHLLSEEKFIYAVLVLTIVFFIFLFIIPIGTYADATGEHFTMEGVEHGESEAH